MERRERHRSIAWIPGLFYGLGVVQAVLCALLGFGVAGGAFWIGWGRMRFPEGSAYLPDPAKASLLTAPDSVIASFLASGVCFLVWAWMVYQVWRALSAIARLAIGARRAETVLPRIRSLHWLFFGNYVLEWIWQMASSPAEKFLSGTYPEVFAREPFGISYLDLLVPSFSGADSLVFALLALVAVRVISERARIESELTGLQQETALTI